MTCHTCGINTYNTEQCIRCSIEVAQELERQRKANVTFWNSIAALAAIWALIMLLLYLAGRTPNA